MLFAILAAPRALVPDSNVIEGDVVHVARPLYVVRVKTHTAGREEGPVADKSRDAHGERVCGQKALSEKDAAGTRARQTNSALTGLDRGVASLGLLVEPGQVDAALEIGGILGGVAIGRAGAVAGVHITGDLDSKGGIKNHDKRERGTLNGVLLLSRNTL